MQITLESPLDMHLHLREGDMLRTVAPLSARCFAGGVIMPNLVSPVDSLEKVKNYKKEIELACENLKFTPFMTLFFQNFTREELTAAKEHIIGVKLYPAGITTQSDAGISNIEAALPTIALMEELQIPLLIHGETGGFVMDREEEFLETYIYLAENYPDLKIVMEHITTAAALSVVDKYTNVGATITLHHLMLTLDDVIGGLMQPHLFCKPIAKRPEDLEALQEAAFKGLPRVFFGSDSAPHPRHKKEACGCAAGVFSAPVALPALTQLFDQAGSLDKLADFLAGEACRFYNLKPAAKKVTLTTEKWRVPDTYGSVRPFLAEKVLDWSITAVE